MFAWPSAAGAAREELGPSFSSDQAAVVGVEDEPATVCVGEHLHKSLGVRASFGLGARITTGAQGVEEIATVASVAVPCKGHKVRERVPRTQHASQGEHEHVELRARAYEQRGRGCFGERAGECEGDFRADADAGVDERQPRRGVACRTRVQLELKPADSEPPTSGRRPDPHGHQPFRPRETDRGVTEFVDEHEHRSAEGGKRTCEHEPPRAAIVHPVAESLQDPGHAALNSAKRTANLNGVAGARRRPSHGTSSASARVASRAFGLNRVMPPTGIEPVHAV
jgi:hypothetical protein